jgi:hypothetical protein
MEGLDRSITMIGSNCRNPTLKECEDDTHIPKMGTWESSGTLENSKLECRGQNALPWGVLYTIGKVLKRRCWKWPPMNHLDICSTSHVAVWFPTTKSQESTQRWCVQVECDTPLESSQGELQVFFRPHPDRRSKQGIMSCQSPGSPNRNSFGTVSGLLFGNPGKKCHWDVGATE